MFSKWSLSFRYRHQTLFEILSTIRPICSAYLIIFYFLTPLIILEEYTRTCPHLYLQIHSVMLHTVTNIHQMAILTAGFITSIYFQIYPLHLGKYKKKLFHISRLRSGRYTYIKKERSVVLPLFLLMIVLLAPLQPPKITTKITTTCTINNATTTTTTTTTTTKTTTTTSTTTSNAGQLQKWTKPLHPTEIYCSKLLIWLLLMEVEKKVEDVNGNEMYTDRTLYDILCEMSAPH